MFFWIAILLCVSAVLAMYMYQRHVAGTRTTEDFSAVGKAKASDRKLDRPARQRKDFRAVSIKPGAHACKAACALASKRGFSSQTPRLPLAACDAEKCSCSYVRHTDRRDMDERRSLFGCLSGSSQIGVAQNHRTGADRRAINRKEHMLKDLSGVL